MRLNKVYIRFSMHELELFIEDAELSDMLRAVFRTEDNSAESILSKKSRIVILGNLKEGYKVTCNNANAVMFDYRETVIFYLLEIIGDIFCESVNEEQYVIHAAAVCFRSKAIAFSGVSGSGKTTSALLFSQYGKFMGDEYGFLDMETGLLRFEDYPFQIKEGNTYLETYKEKYEYLRAERLSGEMTYYFGAEHMRKEEQPIPLGVLVYPHFDISYKETKIGKLSPQKLPIYVLQSLFGNHTPPVSLKRFVALASCKKIKFLEIFFSDGNNMAEKLVSYIEENE